MDLKYCRAPIIVGAIALTLSGCANIATKGVPRCTGVERRPLNADLWDWQATKPATAPKLTATTATPRSDPIDPDAVAIMLYAPERAPSPIELQIRNASDARWNVAASYERCESGEGR